MKKLMLGLFLLLGVFQLTAQESEKAGTWQVRLRAISVIPNESATIEAIGGDVDISTAIVPELDFAYFFTDNLAAELILGTTKHDVEAVKTAAGDIDLGSVWLLPPTLSLQYHKEFGMVKPYVGAGLNYTIFYNVDNGPAADEVSYDNALGYSFQAGLDIDLNEKWFVNVDAKYLLLSTDATVNANTALNATVDAEVDINPLIIGLGVGMKF